ncbi:MAG: hypothetical protein GTO60_16620 [Gammaproteobacteria bacterium]|nr:hypothetical protein [Gammaproteobacteria bacterium]
MTFLEIRYNNGLYESFYGWQKLCDRHGALLSVEFNDDGTHTFIFDCGALTTSTNSWRMMRRELYLWLSSIGVSVFDLI